MRVDIRPAVRNNVVQCVASGAQCCGMQKGWSRNVDMTLRYSVELD